MTGYGEAQTESDGLRIAVEVRTINNRYFKLTVRCSDGYSTLEPDIDAVVRTQIKRGSVQVSLRIDRQPSPEDYQLNVVALESYRSQLTELYQRWLMPGHVHPEWLLSLPGVVGDQGPRQPDLTQVWPVIKTTLHQAMVNLERMRRDEGLAMAAALRDNCQTILAELEEIRLRGPTVVDRYRTRLEERLRRTLDELQVGLAPADITRELAIFCDRCDISEEVVRLASHVDQFLNTLQSPEPSGRKLEFLSQEMFREANTIGSKSNDVEIAQRIIEVKTAIERIRELIQNVE